MVTTRAIVLALKTQKRGALELPFERIDAAVKSATLGRAIVIRRGSNELYFYRVGTKPKLIRTFKVATGRSEYPDSAREVRGRQQAGEPLVVPAGRLRLGEGREADPARGGQPARDAVDGHLLTVRRDSRHAECRFDRLLRVARVHQDADPAGRVAVHPGRARHTGLHRRGMTGRAKTVGQVIAVAAVVGLLALLGWKLAFGNGGGASAELGRWRQPGRARLHAAADRRGGRRPHVLLAQGEGRGRQLLGVVVHPVQGRGARAAEDVREVPRPGSRRPRRRCKGLPPGRQALHEALRDHLPGRRRRQRVDAREVGRHAGSPRRSSSIDEADSSETVVEGGVDLERNRERYAEGIRLALGDSK